MARKQALFRLQFRLLYPGGDGSSGRLGQFELHGPLGLSLYDHRSGQNLIAMGDVAHAQIDQIATAQLAVYSDVEHCQVSDLPRVLKLNSDSPDVLSALAAAFDQSACLCSRVAGFDWIS